MLTMPTPVDAVLEDDRWAQAGLETLAQRAAVCALQHLRLDPGGFEISLLGCDDARIAILNADFREKPQATNVLSWPSEERAAQIAGGEPELPAAGSAGQATELGDIAIAYETCRQEAEAAGKPFAEHVTHLIVHGVLHLLGYDHMNDLDAGLMERLEVEILAKLGQLDPYRG